MPTDIKSRPGLLKAFAASPNEMQEYFEYIPSLLNDYPMHVCLAYVFSRLELGQNMALYSGAVRIHKVDTEVARNAIGKTAHDS